MRVVRECECVSARVVTVTVTVTVRDGGVSVYVRTNYEV